jgi:hypothetical protein
MITFRWSFGVSPFIASQKLLPSNGKVIGQKGGSKPNQATNYSLLIFTAMRANYSKPSAFRRNQIGVISMMKLARQAQRNPALRVNLRVLLLVDFPEECPVLLQKLSALDDRVWDKEHRKTGDGKVTGDSDRSSQYSFVATELLEPEVKGAKSTPNPYDYPICLAVTTCFHPVYDIPTMDCLFRSALTVALPDEYIMFTNSDIVYSTELLNIYVQARDAVTVFPHGFSMFGRRKNGHLETADFYNDSSLNAIMSEAHSERTPDIVASYFDSILEKVVTKTNSHFGYLPPQGSDIFLMPQWGFPLNFPPFMIRRASWDNARMITLIRNHNATHPGPPAIHVTQSVSHIHTGSEADSGAYSDRKGADWMYHVQFNHSQVPEAFSYNTQYYSRGFCNATESARSSDCNVTAESVGNANILDGESKVKGPGVHVTKSGFVFTKRHP